MKYLVFKTEQEAVVAESEISRSMGYPKSGVNAETGELDPNALTLRWAIPQQISDGRWVVPSPDNNGSEANEDWWANQNLGDNK